MDMDTSRYLFRGKQLTTGEWAIGYLVTELSHSMKLRVPKIVDVKSGIATEVYIQTVGQCTGLEDKYGKLIFEDDTVFITRKTTSYTTEGSVEWRDHKWLIARESAEWVSQHYLVEVVGNVHELKN